MAIDHDSTWAAFLFNDASVLKYCEEVPRDLAGATPRRNSKWRRLAERRRPPGRLTIGAVVFGVNLSRRPLALGLQYASSCLTFRWSMKRHSSVCVDPRRW
jgi:hypothetical protein